jgi:solute:Na+ symporter, SSS family
MASWSGLIHSAVFFLIGIKLWAVGKRYGYLTQCEYFRERFNSPALGYILFPILVALVIPYLLVGVIGAGKAMQPITAGTFPDLFPVHRPDGSINPALSGGVPPWIGMGIISGIVLFYVFFGGLRGAVWANTFQTLVFMVTGIIAFYMISTRLGGVTAASQAVAESEMGASRLARAGHIGYGQFFTYCFVPLSVGMFPHLFQHWLTAKSAKSFRLTVVAHPIFIAIVWLPCIMIGIWATAALVPPAADANTVLGRMVNTFVHVPWLSGLLGAGILAAIMSSLDSQFMCIGTMFTRDVVLRITGPDRFTDRQKVWIGRAFILGIVVVTYLLALVLQKGTHVFDLGVWCFSGFASLFPLAVAAVYWKRATKAGAISCVLVTAVVWLVMFTLDMIAKSGRPPGQDDETLVFGTVMPVTIIFAASAAALIIVSLMTRPPSRETIDKFFDPKASPLREPQPAAAPVSTITQP